MATSGFLDVESTRLYYEVAGRGLPVVLLHGGMLNLRQWDEQFDILALEFRVIRYDARGHGSLQPNSAAPILPRLPLGDSVLHASRYPW